MSIHYTLPVVLWGGPLDGKEYSPEEVFEWGSCPHSITVIVPNYRSPDPELEEDDGGQGLYGLPFGHETYYKTRQFAHGCLVYRIGERSRKEAL